jgi:hypothetical protein
VKLLLNQRHNLQEERVEQGEEGIEVRRIKHESIDRILQVLCLYLMKETINSHIQFIELTKTISS